MKGITCPNCEEYYEALGINFIDDICDCSSRHRSNADAPKIKRKKNWNWIYEIFNIIDTYKLYWTKRDITYSIIFHFFSFNLILALFIQYLTPPFYFGPSSNIWPRWLSHWLHLTSVLTIPYVLSYFLTIFASFN